jgi:hypothetical protein
MQRQRFLIDAEGKQATNTSLRSSVVARVRSSRAQKLVVKSRNHVIQTERRRRPQSALTERSGSGQIMHVAALILVGISLALITRSATEHRPTEAGQARYFMRIASGLLTQAMLALALGLARVTFGNSFRSGVLVYRVLSVGIGAWSLFHRNTTRRRTGRSW